MRPITRILNVSLPLHSSRILRITHVFTGANEFVIRVYTICKSVNVVMARLHAMISITLFAFPIVALRSRDAMIFWHGGARSLLKEGRGVDRAPRRHDVQGGSTILLVYLCIGHNIYLRCIPGRRREIARTLIGFGLKPT